MDILEPGTFDPARMTRAQRAALPLSADVAQALAEQHGVCIRPLAMRRIDATAGRVEVVPVPCGSTREDQCPSCADKARRLRMAQCRQGWHLETEPVTERTKPTEEHQALMAARADLLAAYTECKALGDEDWRHSMTTTPSADDSLTIGRDHSHEDPSSSLDRAPDLEF